MVATRSSSANALAANPTSKATIVKAPNKTRRNVKSRAKAVTSPTTPVHPRDTSYTEDSDGTKLAPSSSSPSIGATPPRKIMVLPKGKKAPRLDGTKRTQPPLLPVNDAMPVNFAGALSNPIIVSDSPPRQLTREPYQRHLQQTEPHQFMDNGYRHINYQPPRPVLAPRPAHGNTFTGHRSHDIYRMMNAKHSAAPRLYNGVPHAVPAYTQPFEERYPAIARAAASQRNQPPHTPATHIPSAYVPSAYLPSNYGPSTYGPSPYGLPTYGPPTYTNPHTHQFPPVPRFHILPSNHEDDLRKKAMQYIRESSKPDPRKRKLSEVDPEETSASESEKPSKPKARPSHNASRSINSASSVPVPVPVAYMSPYHMPGVFPVYNGPDHNFQVRQLAEYTSLVTALLKAYPDSKDQKGLREDIAMLTSAHNQMFAKWMKDESQSARKRRKSNTDSAIGVDTDEHDTAATPRITSHGPPQQKTTQDDVVRQFMSAGAPVWQPGVGLNVADVYAAQPAPSPGPTALAKAVDIDGMDMPIEDKTGESNEEADATAGDQA
ncbi:hypothetical protein IQ07DRAFT_651093 [Pyrenochaeta sp. DS3sAY3a]|nr:hypothetical protein IQ07DRAFT_651093 [Pyrenochaeta sp. DS3sAY3a]